MVTAPSPLQELADAAHEAEKIELTAKFDQPGLKELRIFIWGRRNGPSWNGQISFGKTRGNHSSHTYSPVTDLGDAFRQAAANYPKAVLLPDSIQVKVKKGPVPPSRLRPLVIQAWHEAFGLPIPSSEELKQNQKAAKTAKRAADNNTVALLKSGPAGIQEFNQRQLRERTKADLRKADFTGCNLDGVDFGGANLEGADLSGASLVGAEFWGSPLPSRLRGAKLVGANLTGASFPRCHGNDADFSQAILRGADLGHGNYLRARFVGADLTGARLSGSDLRGADFTGAKLDDLRIEWGKFDEHTRWPAGFQPPAELTWKGSGPDPRLAPAPQQAELFSPTDFNEFLDGLKAVTDLAKLQKALAMLKAERFQLFAQVAADHLVGVVKSQSDPGLVYSCRLARDGTYACCTQNLNVCGGLRGSPCKHLLVLIIGLAKAGELEPAAAHAWVQASRGRKPALDKDRMAETLLRYKGAEAGEVDWRPTETIPEDFYAM